MSLGTIKAEGCNVDAQYRDLLLYGIGLEAAHRVAVDFPAFHRKHVAHRTITMETLARVATAWARLVHRHIMELETTMEFQELADGVPEDALSEPMDETWLDARLEQEIQIILERPRPRVFGLDRDVQEMNWNDASPSMLSVAIWALVQYSSYAGFLADDLDDWLADRADIIDVVIEPLPPATDMAELCIALNASPLSNQCGARLGDIVQYACGQTGNWYADLSDMDVDEMDWSIDWDTYRSSMAEQRAAYEMASQYLDLMKLADADLFVLNNVIDGIWSVFRETQGNRLVNILGDEDDVETFDIQALAA